MGQIQERFALFVEKSGYTKQFIEKKLGLSNGYVGKIVAGKSSFSVEILENIIATFSELNPMWLVVGEGDIFLKPNTNKELQSLPTDIQQTVENMIEKKLTEILQKRGLLA